MHPQPTPRHFTTFRKFRFFHDFSRARPPPHPRPRVPPWASTAAGTYNMRKMHRKRANGTRYRSKNISPYHFHASPTPPIHFTTFRKLRFFHDFFTRQAAQGASRPATAADQGSPAKGVPLANRAPQNMFFSKLEHKKFSGPRNFTEYPRI